MQLLNFNETRVFLDKEKIMKVNFDITKIVFTPSCDNYDFTLGITRDYKGNKCYLGIDIPVSYTHLLRQYGRCRISSC